MATRIDFARRVLAAGDFPHHLNNYVSLLAWMEGEGTKAKYNPLATTRPEPKATNFNSTGVKNYPTIDVGVKATVDTLHNGNYNEVIKSLLKAEVAQNTLTAVQNSRWGTHFDQLPSFIEHIRSDWSTYAFKAL